jgi:hypothetical protein
MELFNNCRHRCMPKEKEETMKRTAKSRRSKPLGATDAHHSERATGWFTSAENNLLRIMKAPSYRHNPCSAIAHYGDVVTEATVAEVEAGYAGNKTKEKAAAHLAKLASQWMMDSVNACRTGKPLNGSKRRRK